MWSRSRSRLRQLKAKSVGLYCETRFNQVEMRVIALDVNDRFCNDSNSIHVLLRYDVQFRSTTDCIVADSS